MAIDFDPIVGDWYEHADKGQKFEVLSIDEDSGTVEIQYYDGDIEEMDYEAWYDMNIEPSAPPDEWIGPLNDLDEDDLDYSEAESEPEDLDEADEEAPRRGRRGGRRRKTDDKDDEEIEIDDDDYGDDEWEE